MVIKNRQHMTDEKQITPHSQAPEACNIVNDVKAKKNLRLVIC